MQILKTVNQLLMFSLELGMLASLGYLGFTVNSHTYGKYLTGFGLPLLAALLWGYFAAPRSVHRLDTPYRALFGLTLFGLTALLLYKTGYTQIALWFGALAVICEAVTLFVE